ncbi:MULTISPECIES: hypothetical protein [Streptomyces]|uniref:DUF4232 domain-containing protein n=2 Tax=Streptomyces TaxID=1883 RepID=A0ABW0B8M5_9ACTN|nr:MULTISPECIES: hypothetical protein [Streptomyces]KPC82083.1 hypothetical protein ADK82_12180 [Streptomyces sp. NRRL S-4]
MSGPENRHDDDRTGNGTVNHGPENTPNTDPGQGGERQQDQNREAAEGAEAASGPSASGLTASGPTAPVSAASGPVSPGADSDDADSSAPGRGGLDSGALDQGGPAAGSGGTLTELFRGGGEGASGSDHGGPGDPGASGGTGGGGMDEVALRRMLRGAVEGLAPSDGTLDHLHRAVPARRARRRQGVVGAAAAALLLGTAVPAFVHVAGSDGSATANPAIAGHGEQAQGGSGEEAGAEADGGNAAGPSDRRTEGAEGDTGKSTAPTRGSDPGADRSGAEGLDDPPGSDLAATRVCDPGQLGVASADAGAAGADGTVYGTFRIANVSGEACSVTSNGTVGFQAAGAADPLKITVVQHTAGDPAAGLPDPSLEPGTVFLKPAMTYEVRFAWVPSDTCPATGGSPSPTPTDGGGGGGEGAGEGAGAAAGTTDTAAQFGRADGGPADGSIAVTHTPEAGAPTAETTIANACAGTIYRTGVLDAS